MKMGNFKIPGNGLMGLYALTFTLIQHLTLVSKKRNPWWEEGKTKTIDPITLFLENLKAGFDRLFFCLIFLGLNLWL